MSYRTIKITITADENVDPDAFHKDCVAIAGHAARGAVSVDAEHPYRVRGNMNHFPDPENAATWRYGSYTIDAEVV